MTLAFIGYWFETDWMLIKFSIPIAIGCWWWEAHKHWKRGREVEAE